MDIRLGDVVQMKKPHPCGSSTWTVTRVGADIKIRCQGCARVVMLDRWLFEKRLKKILERVDEGEMDGTGTAKMDGTGTAGGNGDWE